MVTGLLYSIMPPFYPKEAEDRGLKSNQVTLKSIFQKK